MATFNVIGNVPVYSEIRDFTGDDYLVTVTLGTGLVGYTLAGHLYTAGGLEILTVVVVAVTDPVNGVFTVAIAGQDLDPTPYYGPFRWSVQRADAAYRTVLAWGTLDLTDPTGGQGPSTAVPTNLTAPGIANQPVNLTPPAIMGTPTQGQTLTAFGTTWSGAPTALAYQWLRDGLAISGATAPTYTLQAADIGALVAVQVIASNANGPSAPVASAAVGPVAAAGAVPANSVLPLVTGSTVSGQTLTSTTGTWSNSPTGYAYQWQSNGSNVGANQNTYALQGSDVGNTVACTVTASNVTGSGAPATSAGVGPVTAPVPVNSVPPAISGSTTSGSTLSATTGTWSNAPTGYAYQWKSGVSNVGTNVNAYTLQVSDVGNTVTVTVTASNSGGAGTPATSSAVGPVTSGGGGGTAPMDFSQASNSMYVGAIF